MNLNCYNKLLDSTGDRKTFIILGFTVQLYYSQFFKNSFIYHSTLNNEVIIYSLCMAHICLYKILSKYYLLCHYQSAVVIIVVNFPIPLWLYPWWYYMASGIQLTQSVNSQHYKCVFKGSMKGLITKGWIGLSGLAQSKCPATEAAPGRNSQPKFLLKGFHLLPPYICSATPRLSPHCGEFLETRGRTKLQVD